jgi:hypothetical protein
MAMAFEEALNNGMIGPVLFATSALEFPFFRRCTASIF